MLRRAPTWIVVCFWTILTISVSAYPSFHVRCICSPRQSVQSLEPWYSYLYTTRVAVNPLFSSSSSSDDDEESTNYDVEETLMKLYFTVNDNVTKDVAMQRVSRYCQSFPFAAVLPVQPLQYLPTEDGGVDVRFLRKKTKEKGSLDGGIRFFVSEDREGIDVVAKRNSQGQTVSKMFSEKLVVLSFIKRVTGEEMEKTSPPPTDVVTLSSAFHKWME